MDRQRQAPRIPGRKRRTRTEVPAIAIVGYSGSGKTTIASALVRILTDRGYRIGAIKHTPHGHDGPPGAKDSERLFDAGAERVLASGPGRITTVERAGRDTSPERLLAAFESGFDLVILEGFQESRLPRIIVAGAEPMKPTPSVVIAVVGEGERAIEAPRYTLDDPAPLADLIEREIMGRRARGPQAGL